MFYYGQADQKTLEELRKKLEADQKTLEELRKKLEADQKTLETSRGLFAKEVTIFDRQRLLEGDMWAKVLDLNTEIEQLTNIIEILRQRGGLTNEQLIQQQDTIKTLLKHNSMLFDQLCEKHPNLESVARNFEKELESLRSELQQKDTLISNRDETISTMKLQQIDIKKELQHLRAENNRLHQSFGEKDLSGFAQDDDTTTHVTNNFEKLPETNYVTTAFLNVNIDTQSSKTSTYSYG
jgi:hypothetical protein